jgi:hypothetical protein
MDAADRTLPRLPVQSQIGSDLCRPTFVQMNSRNMQQLAKTIVAVRNSRMLDEERMHELGRGHAE